MGVVAIHAELPAEPAAGGRRAVVHVWGVGPAERLAQGVREAWGRAAARP